MREPGADASQAEPPPVDPRDDPPAQAIEDARRGQVALALAIVVVSILAATMAWRASVADDAASESTLRAEQNLLQRQELRASDESIVLHDIAVFGTYEENENLARLLRRSAARVPGREARALALRAQQDLQLAQQESALFEVALPSDAHGTVTFDAAYARRAARLRDANLLDLEAPSTLRSKAGREETKGLRLTGLAVLFVAALVFFTFAQLIGASISSLLAVSGTLVAVTAIVLFISIG